MLNIVKGKTSLARATMNRLRHEPQNGACRPKTTRGPAG
jgi:hypothetical protein